MAYHTYELQEQLELAKAKGIFVKIPKILPAGPCPAGSHACSRHYEKVGQGCGMVALGSGVSNDLVVRDFMMALTGASRQSSSAIIRSADPGISQLNPRIMTPFCKSSA